MLLTKVWLPNGKELIFLFQEEALKETVWQSTENEDWERIDVAVFEHTPIPRESKVQVKDWRLL